MPRFRVIVTGVSQVLGDGDATGFATTRFVRAVSPGAAGEAALAGVAADIATDSQFEGWQSPTLAVDTVVLVRRPFKLSRPGKGFTFFQKGATLEDALRIERKVGTGWFF